MKNKITKIILALMVLVNGLVMAPHAKANSQDLSSLIIPVRFQYNIDTEGLEQGDALPLEITQDVFYQGKKLFRQGGAGYALIDELKKARFLGRGGKVKITRGQLVDINGNNHTIYLTANAKGDYKFSSPAGVLMGAGSAFNIAEAGLKSGTATGSIFAAGSLLIPVAFLFKKGKEAKISKGKIMFARIGIQ